MEDNIIYHSEDVIRLVEKKLDGFKPFQYDSRTRMLLGNEFVNKITQWEHSVRERKDDPFTLVVCGEFKRGKSSLINAILKEDVVPVNVTTETVTLNKISYGPHSNEAVLSGGRRLQLTDDELAREFLEQKMEQIGEHILTLEIKRPIEMLRTINIIDTPGLGDALKDFSELVDYSLQQADAVIYVFSANYPLSRTEQLFLKSRILPQKYTDLFLVANYSDCLPDADGYQRMQDLLMQRIQGLLPGKAPLMLSALDERCIQCGEERPNPELQDILSEAFVQFRTQLETLITQKKHMVLPNRMQRLVSAMAEDLSEMLHVMESGLDMSEQEAQAAIERMNQQCDRQQSEQADVQKKIAEQIQDMQATCHVWIEDLLNKMEAELDKLSSASAEDLTKYYSFYCIDLIQEGMTKVLEYHTDLIYDLADDISSEITGALYQSTEKKKYHFRFALDNQTWTKGDNVSYITNWLGMGALSLITDGIAGAMRQKEIKDHTPDMIRKIREQYRLLRSSTNQTIDETYGKMEKNLMEQLVAYHANEIRIAKERATQSASVACQDAQKKEEIRTLIKELRVVIADLEEAWK